MIEITLPDGSKKDYSKGTQVKEAVQDISMGLYNASVGAVLNGKVLGMNDKMEESGDFKVVKFQDEEGKEIFWHTSSHVLAHAIQNLYPDVKFAIGPAIKDGFYYDIDMDHRLVPEDLEKIEAEMTKIARSGLDMEKIDLTRQEALDYFDQKGEIYKVELINDLPEDEAISLYKSGDFIDLCAGPHLENTKSIKAIKLLSIAGAYWRGSEENQMLQRIYGISFEKQKDLEEYLKMREEAEKRDHRKLSKELELFYFHETGPGFPFYLPKGTILKNELLGWWRQVLDEQNYGEVSTPTILNKDLWVTSGHWANYRENMYLTKIDEEEYAIKPMNCPGSTLVYASKPRSYRDLPIRMSEFGHVHRHELSGALHGLFRVRAFTQDDAHVYCLPDQVEDEVFELINLAELLYSTFGFKYSLELSTRPENYMGELAEWDMAEKALKAALNKRGLDYEINEGDGAFYGPKIDFQLEDAIGRTWQCGTIQLDFQLPQNFDLTYTDNHGEEKRPVMLHRALLGSVERFLGILIEHFEGKFPLWISPEQIRVLPVSEKFMDYAKDVQKQFKDAGFRAELDQRDEKLGYKIRSAQMDKVNYVFVVGAEEEEKKNISVRVRDGEDLGQKEIAQVIEDLRAEIESKEIR